VACPHLLVSIIANRNYGFIYYFWWFFLAKKAIENKAELFSEANKTVKNKKFLFLAARKKPPNLFSVVKKVIKNMSYFWQKLSDGQKPLKISNFRWQMLFLQFLATKSLPRFLYYT
jgi:hypothetical protein